MPNVTCSRTPTLRFIIPHGGGAGPTTGAASAAWPGAKETVLKDHLLQNIFFDTCVYHQAGIDLLTRVIPVDNILFASEMIGAVRGIDPETGHSYDDTKRYIEAAHIDPDQRHRIYEVNARRVYSRLDAALKAKDVDHVANSASCIASIRRADSDIAARLALSHQRPVHEAMGRMV